MTWNIDDDRWKKNILMESINSNNWSQWLWVHNMYYIYRHYSFFCEETEGRWKNIFNANILKIPTKNSLVNWNFSIYSSQYILFLLHQNQTNALHHFFHIFNIYYFSGISVHIQNITNPFFFCILNLMQKNFRSN